MYLINVFPNLFHCVSCKKSWKIVRSKWICWLSSGLLLHTVQKQKEIKKLLSVIYTFNVLKCLCFYVLAHLTAVMVMMLNSSITSEKLCFACALPKQQYLFSSEYQKCTCISIWQKNILLDKLQNIWLPPFCLTAIMLCWHVNMTYFANKSIFLFPLFQTAYKCLGRETQRALNYECWTRWPLTISARCWEVLDGKGLGLTPCFSCF